MKVIHIACGSTSIQPSGAGGVQKDLYFLTKYLSDLDCDVGVIDINSKDHRKLQSSARIHRVWNPPISGEVCGTLSHVVKVSIFSILAALRLRRLLKEDKIDIIHTHGQFPGAAILLFKRLFRWSIPIVHTIHNANILMHPTKISRLKYFLELITWHKANVLIVETQTGHRQLQSEFNIKPDKIVVVPQGLDLKQIDDFTGGNHGDAKESNETVVLYVARVCSRKNQLALIEAAPKVLQKFSETRFVFVGPIEDRSYFRKISQVIRDEKLNSSIKFTGELRGNMLFEAYRNATIFAFPTLYETQGVVLLEAMAFGLPVVASDIGPIRDVVSSRQGSALLINPYDVDDIANAIIQLLSNSSLRSKTATEGKNLVHENFDWPMIAKKMLTVYEEIATYRYL